MNILITKWNKYIIIKRKESMNYTVEYYELRLPITV